ncbi:hypothetical protein [Streptomyces subrutilus]|uniref:Uncharacterized protein n=1 Tax=Streptomyces subrutilus TaxID=36818 RepID=A0A1E5Q0P5_9ACTN|nr:hypothetical protein [Streptomyces subrutilus]OEJ35323.1 hypothetical protein BGK67_32130 [Streptomyces subrutilus]
MTGNTPPTSSSGNPYPVSRRTFVVYTTALAYLLGAAVLRETQPATSVITAITWTSVAYGAGCILHLVGKAALQRFLSWIKRELNNGGPSQPPGGDV